ncbi:MAG: MFS transporter, partial [Bacteroidetes bacterium]
MNSKIFRISLIAALAGFLFGFDTVVISGAEKKLQVLWDTSDAFHGTVVIGMALFGTVIGAMFGGVPTNRLGRKNTLFWIGVLYSLSAIGSALSNDPVTFGIFRFLGGLGIGASTVAAPSYISEIAPARQRGRLVGLYQFNIVFGILIAFFSNYLLNGISDNDWRWMVGVEAFPAVIYTFFALGIPKSPRWLMTRGREEEAGKVLDRLGSELTVEQLQEDMMKSEPE